MHLQCQNFLILSHLSEPFDVPAGCVRAKDGQKLIYDLEYVRVGVSLFMSLQLKVSIVHT